MHDPRARDVLKRWLLARGWHTGWQEQQDDQVASELVRAFTDAGLVVVDADRHQALERQVAAVRALVDDERYHVGGAWGDYGEPVLLARNVAEALGEEYDRPRDERTADYAATHAEAVEAAELSERELDALRYRLLTLVAAIETAGVHRMPETVQAEVGGANDMLAALSATPEEPTA